ncbi:two component, sigma54 specific, transcriptional regulator, Fis family [Candidatus Vecturithrix granuli]|uniref:Two component, sigma54 specific, transcriptional regulator, Fis family n=1 Tax=Vecturithrix granuli TaxID=1499967 RepID=A0A081BY46_VECG1|nr:two component, sigma54 specific, transcriptional regulator, Fis family [Candidatus Vecturithrix granuli]
MKATILIIDDNVKWCKSLAQNFVQRGYTPVYATTSTEAHDLLARTAIDLVLLDIMLGEENGVDLLKDILLLQPRLPVIMITGFGSIDTAVQSIKLGAFDYVTKPLEFDKLLQLVEHAMNVSCSRDYAPESFASDFPELITHNAAMLALCEKARKFAGTNLPILICGENGTGKEIIADVIHAHSTRSEKPMLKINCSAFPETLLDNELFGHEKGAYTGAETVFKGIFERAHGSSLFLDEIGDMPATIQAKILRALQNHEIRRIGSERVIKVNVRFITATNKDLRQLITNSAFREDLFYRLNVATIKLPPLRERKEDIPLLAEYFLAEHAKTNPTCAQRFSEAVIARFVSHSWPGNVRELKNTVHYAATICTNACIDIPDLPPHFLPKRSPQSSDNIRDDMERALILDMLQKTNFNKKKTAELLNMSRNTLYNKLEKYGIGVPE